MELDDVKFDEMDRADYARFIGEERFKKTGFVKDETYYVHVLIGIKSRRGFQDSQYPPMVITVTEVLHGVSATYNSLEGLLTDWDILEFSVKPDVDYEPTFYSYENLCDIIEHLKLKNERLKERLNSIYGSSLYNEDFEETDSLPVFMKHIEDLNDKISKLEAEQWVDNLDRY